MIFRDRHDAGRRLAAELTRLAPEHPGTVIVVDDGLATGLSVLAVALLRDEADAVVGLEVPEDLYSVGGWYTDFSQVTDEQVTSLLAAAGRAREPQTALPVARAVTADAGGLVLCAHGSRAAPGAPRAGGGAGVEEPGALEMVARLAGDWFAKHLAARLPVADAAV
jgi:hypothetical protein